MAKTLAVIYRPKKFEDVCEQKNVIGILQNQLASGECKNAYLFCGGAGTGKTTCARIFANELNGGKGVPIEIDGASNNGVENVRGIIEQAKYMPLEGQYKVYILDECFHKDTMIDTPTGLKRICEIKPGDEVYNLTGKARVSNVFENNVLTDRLCFVIINGRRTLTTVDHLYFTRDGWVSAKDLKQGDFVYDYDTLCNLRKRISNKPNVCKEDLFKRMQEFFDIKIGNGEEGLRTSSSSNEREQSYDKSSNGCQNGGYKKEKWEFLKIMCRTGREWALYEASDSFEERPVGGVDFRVSHSDRGSEKGTHLPDLLQSRPRLAKIETGDRGGWCRPQYEISTIARYEESGFSSLKRVDGVEVFKRGNNEELFRSYFSSEQFDSGIVQMYDLEVAGHPSYFANGALVHNCHMLSIGAWNAMLKLLEEPPARTIFIFCTTDVMKVPNTILSRVQKYDFCRISREGIVARLKYICGQEKLSADDDALEYLATLAAGGMRDAISLMDKCLSYSKNLTLKSVSEALGIVSYDTLLSILTEVKNADVEAVLTIIDGIYKSGLDIKQFVKSFATFSIDISIYATTGKMIFTRLPLSCKITLDGLLKNFTKDDLLALVDRVLRLQNDIKYDPSPLPLVQAFFVNITYVGENK